MAFLLALVIILIMGYDEPRITYVEEKGAAAAAGLMEEDRVLRLNGSKVHLSRDISFVQSVYPSEPMKFVIAREENGKTVEKEILVVPEKQQFYQIGMYITENSRKIDSFTDVSPAREAGLKRRQRSGYYSENSGFQRQQTERHGSAGRCGTGNIRDAGGSDFLFPRLCQR